MWKRWSWEEKEAGGEEGDEVWCVSELQTGEGSEVGCRRVEVEFGG